MTSKNIFLKFVVVSSCLLVFAAARANVVGNDTQNFNPTTSGLDFVTAQSSQTLAPGVLNFGYFLNGAKNVLPETVDASGGVVGSSDSIFGQDFDVGYGLTDSIDIGLNISHVLSQATDRSEPGAQFAKTGLNEIRANLKYRLFDRSPVGLAFVPSINFNQVKNNPFLGSDASPTANFEFAADVQIDAFLVALNGGYRFRSPGSAIAGAVYSPLSDQVIASLAASHYFSGLDTKLIAEIFGAYQVSKSQLLESDRLSLEALLGVKVDVSNALAVHSGISTRIGDGLFAPDVRGYVGLNYSLVAFQHAAPNVRTKIEADSVSSATNYSTEETHIYQGFQPKDIEAMKTVAFDELARAHEFALRRAVELDRSDAFMPPFEIVRLDGLVFENASYKILDRNKPLLEQLVKYLNSSPPVLKIRVEGHTDSNGHEDRNARLSANRASAIRQFLIARGLSNTIAIETIGYGSSKPIADNSNFQGREANRRVEVRILRSIPVKAPKVEVKKETS